MPQVRLTIFTPKVAQSNFAKSHKRPNLPVILKKVINKKQAAWLNPPPPPPSRLLQIGLKRIASFNIWLHEFVVQYSFDGKFLNMSISFGKVGFLVHFTLIKEKIT